MGLTLKGKAEKILVLLLNGNVKVCIFEVSWSDRLKDINCTKHPKWEDFEMYVQSPYVWYRLEKIVFLWHEEIRGEKHLHLQTHTEPKYILYSY